MAKKNEKSGMAMTEEEQLKMLELRNMGFSMNEIAEKMGRSIVSVRRVIKRGSVKKPLTNNWSEEEISKLKEMCSLGVEDKNIAAVLGRSVEAVHSKRIELGISKRDYAITYDYSPDDLDDIAVMLSQRVANDNAVWDKTYDDLSKLLKVGRWYKISCKKRDWKGLSYAMPLVFVGELKNYRGRPLFVFKSEAGFTECFTLQQMRDIKLKEVKEVVMK